MLLNSDWRLKEPIESFFFDCDSTLSLIEGIDELATMNGVGQEVHAITERCMSTTGLSIKEYRQRLDYVQPTLQQVNHLAELYATHSALGVREIIQLLQRLNKKIYILSAGIKSAVSQFAQTLKVPAEYVLAVDVYFDDLGNYKGFNEQSHLVQPNGKTLEITSVIKPGEHSLLIGDGMSDWEARESVTRFIGFAGLKGKDWLRKNSEFYITNSSFFALIPLSLTEEEVTRLSPKEFTYYEKGLEEIEHANVLMKGYHHV